MAWLSSEADTVDRLHPADLQEAAVVEAIFLYNTSERDAMMPRKPYPDSENDRQMTAPTRHLPQRHRRTRHARHRSRSPPGRSVVISETLML